MGILGVGRDANEMATLSLERFRRSTIRDLLYNVEFSGIYGVKIA
jgi:hypothetical protein